MYIHVGTKQNLYLLPIYLQHSIDFDYQFGIF